MARFYTGTIDDLLGLIEAMESLSQEAHATTAIAGYLSLLKAKERAGLERAMGAAGFGAGVFSSELHRKLINLVGQQDAFIATFVSHATPDQQSSYRQQLSGAAINEVERLRKIAIESPYTNNLQGVSGVAWFEATTRRIDLMKTVEDRLSEDLLALVEDLRESAQSGYLMITGFLVTMITALTAFGFLIARNISGPISEIVATIEAYKPGDLLIKRWVYRKSTAPLPAWTR